jgi:succinate dehydrogenase/fumarate reductase flavoprotein subunit
MILLSAIHRKESRAAHYRSDYRKTKSEWKKNIICTPARGQIVITTRPVKKVPEEIARLFKVKAGTHHLE